MPPMTDLDAVPVSDGWGKHDDQRQQCEHARHRDSAQDIFKKIDQDGDGKVTKDELENRAGEPARRRRANSNGPSLDDLFSRIDTNGDGSIDESENNAFLDAQAKNRPQGQHGQHGQQGPPDSREDCQRLSRRPIPMAMGS